jgi:hypothetical protein
MRFECNVDRKDLVNTLLSKTFYGHAVVVGPPYHEHKKTRKDMTEQGVVGLYRPDGSEFVADK